MSILPRSICLNILFLAIFLPYQGMANSAPAISNGDDGAYQWRKLFESMDFDNAFFLQKEMISVALAEKLSAKQVATGIQVEDGGVFVHGHLHPNLIPLRPLFSTVASMIETRPGIVEYVIEELFERGFSGEDLGFIRDLAVPSLSMKAFVQENIQSYMTDNYPELAFLMDASKASTTPSTDSELKLFLDTYVEQKEIWENHFVITFFEALSQRSKMVLVKYLYEKFAPNMTSLVQGEKISLQELEQYRDQMQYPRREEQ